MSRPEIRHSTDFDRIAELPRRRLVQADAVAWAAALTPELRAPGAGPGVALRPWQAYAIAECVEQHGGFLALPVGLGKTLITYLVPRLMGAKRPILIVPAALRDKTRADFAAYVGQWRAPNPPLRIVTREELSIERGSRLLDALDPDLI
jgi:hypothetical protein